MTAGGSWGNDPQMPNDLHLWGVMVSGIYARNHDILRVIYYAYAHRMQAAIIGVPHRATANRNHASSFFDEVSTIRTNKDGFPTS